jgi:hypothetical protein
MSHTTYLTIVYSLGLKPQSKKLSLYLGLSVRQLQRIANRECPIPLTVERLLSLYATILDKNPRPKDHPQ